MIDETVDGVRIQTGFRCGAGTDLEQREPGLVRFVVPSDPPSKKPAAGYDYFFHMRLEKDGADAPDHVTVEAVRPRNATSALTWKPSKVPLFASRDGVSWFVLPDVQATARHQDYRVRVPLPDDGPVFISNSVPCPFDVLEQWVRDIAAAHPDQVTLHEVAKSLDGRPVLLLRLTEGAAGDDKDRVLVTAGTHPAEPDWLVPVSIVTRLLDGSEWSKRVLQENVVDVIAAVNPDGFDRGTNACNTKGVNLYWDFRANDDLEAPESVGIWRWVTANPPDLFLDFHAYVHQIERDYRPYIRPLSSYRPEARGYAHAVGTRLTRLCHGRQARGAITESPFTLAVQMQEAFGTVAFPKFHVHLARGIPSCWEVGRRVFEEAVDGARPFRPLRERIRPTAAATGWTLDASWRAREFMQWAAAGAKDRAERKLRGWSKRGGKPLELGAPTQEAQWRNHVYGAAGATPFITVTTEMLRSGKLAGDHADEPVRSDK